MRKSVSQGELVAPPLKHRKHVGAGFKKGCAPYIALAVITGVLCLAELITNWMAYRAFAALHIEDSIQRNVTRAHRSNSAVLNTLYDVFLHITVIYLCLCCVASVLMVGRLPVLHYMFHRAYKQFKSTRDGVPHKKTAVERYGVECCFLVVMSLQTLPVLTVILITRLIADCVVHIVFDDRWFLICVYVTLSSVIWKLLLLVLSVCVSHKDERSCVSRALRTVLCVTLIAGATLASVNIVLLKNQSYISSHSGPVVLNTTSGIFVSEYHKHSSYTSTSELCVVLDDIAAVLANCNYTRTSCNHTCKFYCQQATRTINYKCEENQSSETGAGRSHMNDNSDDNELADDSSEYNSDVVTLTNHGWETSTQNDGLMTTWSIQTGSATTHHRPSSVIHATTVQHRCNTYELVYCDMCAA